MFLLNFDVLLDAQLAIEGLNAYVMQHNVVARRDGAHLVENTLGDGGARNGVNDNVGVREERDGRRPWPRCTSSSVRWNVSCRESERVKSAK